MKYHVLCAVLIVFVVVSIGILGSVPPVDRDSLTHHLYVSKLSITAYVDSGVWASVLALCPAGSGRTVEALLHQQGITHLLIRYDLFDRWLSTLTDNDKETMARFFQTRTRLLFSSGGHELFALEE